MKKGATKTSGIITLILYILLFVFSVFIASGAFGIDAISNIVSSNEMIAKILLIVTFPFLTFPLLLVAMFVPGIETEMVSQVLCGVFAAFSLFMIFWGIKELSLTKKDDATFARCKKTCGFMMFIKFMLFLYFAAIVACSFVMEEVKLAVLILETATEMPNMILILCGVLAVLHFVIFLLPTMNFAKVAKSFSADPNAQYNQNGQYDPNAGYYDPNMQYNGQQMQANMPPMQGYQPQYNNNGQPQPIYNNAPPPGPSIQAQFNPEVQAQEQQMASAIMPGQNGVPVNITPKGIQDLERLERLRASGAITEENYAVMRTKICNTNVS